MDDDAPTIEELLETVEEQANGIRMLIDMATKLEKRVRRLELEDRKRDRKIAKLVTTDGERIA